MTVKEALYKILLLINCLIDHLCRITGLVTLADIC